MKFFRTLALAFLMLSVSATALAAEFRMGDEGSEIAELQGQLIELGYDLVADGAFGPAMADAVKAFQASQGIKPDGMIGPATYAALLGRDMPDISRGSNIISRRIISGALQYLGVPYVFGGTTPYGFDCSGYVQYVFAKAGISLPRTADVQYEVGTPISSAELIPGDVVFFTTYTYGASHVGIYLGEGNFVHASSSSGVTVSSLNSAYWSTHYIGSRRII